MNDTNASVERDAAANLADAAMEAVNDERRIEVTRRSLHHVRFYKIKPRSITVMAYSKIAKRLAVGR